MLAEKIGNLGFGLPVAGWVNFGKLKKCAPNQKFVTSFSPLQIYLIEPIISLSSFFKGPKIHSLPVQWREVRESCWRLQSLWEGDAVYQFGRVKTLFTGSCCKLEGHCHRVGKKECEPFSGSDLWLTLSTLLPKFAQGLFYGASRLRFRHKLGRNFIIIVKFMFDELSV